MRDFHESYNLFTILNTTITLWAKGIGLSSGN